MMQQKFTSVEFHFDMRNPPRNTRFAIFPRFCPLNRQKHHPSLIESFDEESEYLDR